MEYIKTIDMNRKAIYDQFFSIDGIAFPTLKNRLKSPKFFSKEEHDLFKKQPWYNCDKEYLQISIQEISIAHINQYEGITFSFCVDNTKEWVFYDFTFLPDMQLPMSYEDYHKFEIMLNL